VLEAVFDRRTDFARTPKYSIEGAGGADWRSKKYRSPRDFSLVGELVLAAYFLVSLVFAVSFRYWAAVPFLLVFFNGFAYTAALSLSSWRGPRQPAAS
jgi:hypothetical protein